jgi:hypothetical protein
MLKFVIPVIAASFISISAAQAAPLSVPALDLATSTSPADLIQVQHRHRDSRHRDSHRHHRYDRHRHHRYDRHRSRRHPPRGWHRFHHRPHNWRMRGCIAIGPAWFCP